MADPRHEFGDRGERLAESFLVARGMKLVARHYNTRAGELDLIMRDGETLVFVEVKSRRDRRLAEPHDAVNQSKQGKLIRAAEWFVRERRLERLPCRFDVVDVVVAEEGAPDIQHIPDAFLPDV